MDCYLVQTLDISEFSVNGRRLAADPQFAAAVDSLWQTEGLVIDLRWNSGGWSEFDAAFGRMFSERIYTTEDGWRVTPSSLALTPMGNAADGLIPGVPGSIYDRPLAVLLGPTCVSLGDWTAQRLRYHPMVRFFGKTSIASIGFSDDVSGWNGWWLHYSQSDVFHISHPGAYLNRVEFPIDEPVWFSADDVARGIDPVLSGAVNWIFALSHLHTVEVPHPYGRPGVDYLTVTAVLNNPDGHDVRGTARVRKGDASIIDSLVMYNDGLHGDSLPGDSIWGVRFLAPVIEGFYSVDIQTDDITVGSSRRLPAVKLFTTAGPVVCAGDTMYAEPHWGVSVTFRLKVSNQSSSSAIPGVKGTIRALDTAAIAYGSPFSVGDLATGQTRMSTIIRADFSQGGQGERDTPFELRFSSQGIEYWVDTLWIHVTPLVGIVEELMLPATYQLDQNYPNPFNPSTTITYKLPHVARVNLTVFNTLGQEVAAVLNEDKPAGVHTVQFEAAGLPSGVYLYRLTAGSFVQTRKMIIVK